MARKDFPPQSNGRSKKPTPKGTAPMPTRRKTKMRKADWWDGREERAEERRMRRAVSPCGK